MNNIQSKRRIDALNNLSSLAQWGYERIVDYPLCISLRKEIVEKYLNDYSDGRVRELYDYYLAAMDIGNQNRLKAVEKEAQKEILADAA